MSSFPYSAMPAPQRTAASLQAQIASLKEAIAQITATKKTLKHNVMEVKTEIQSSVSRQLECLRSRELHLLQQVEVIQAAKEELLSQQQDSLHQALGGLHTLGHDSPHHALQSGLELLDLLPEETSHIKFQADPTRLRESIREFGRVDTATTATSPGMAKPLSPLDALSPCNVGAASLPNPFEEYEDEEHHVLYKTVGDHAGRGSTASQDGTRTIQVSIPRLTQPPQDWLFLPSVETQVPRSPPAESCFIFPPFQAASQQHWLAGEEAAVVGGGAEGGAVARKGLGMSSSAASLQQWLVDLQNQATMGDEEEEDGGEAFEMLSPGISAAHSHRGLSSASSDIEVLSVSNLPVTHVEAPTQDSPGDTTEAYFSQVSVAPISAWLLLGEREMTQGGEEGLEHPYQVLQYFRDASNDIKDWLSEYQAAKQEEDIEMKLCCSSTCVHAGTPPPQNIDIENLDGLMCVAAPQPPAEYPPWRLTTHTDEDRDVDEQEEVDDAVMKVCRANEPCQTFSECLCDENCCGRLQEEEKEVDETEWLDSTPSASPTHQPANESSPAMWLSQPKSPAVQEDLVESPICQYLSWLAGQESSEWLLDTETTEQESPVGEYFQNLAGQDSTVWLKSEEGSEIDVGGAPNPFTAQPSSTGPWLLHEATDNQGSPQETRDPSLSEWLLHGNKEVSEEPKISLTSSNFQSIHGVQVKDNCWLQEPRDANQNIDNKDATDNKSSTEDVNKWLHLAEPATKTIEDDEEGLKVDRLVSSLENFSMKSDLSLWLSPGKQVPKSFPCNLATAKTNEMPEYADSECGKETPYDTDNMFQCFKESFANGNINLHDWLVNVNDM